MKRMGRPREKDVPQYLLDKMPKKETEEHRQMKAYFLNLPPEQRNRGGLRRTAEKFNCSYDKAFLTSRAFGWMEEVKQRNAEDLDLFIAEHKPLIDDTRIKSLHLYLQHLENEIIRAGLTPDKLPVEIEEKAKLGDMDGAGNALLVYIKSLPMRAKDYKDLNNLIAGIQNILFTWNPNIIHEKTPNINIGGEGSKILIEFTQSNERSLIIEKA